MCISFLNICGGEINQNPCLKCYYMLYLNLIRSAPVCVCVFPGGVVGSTLGYHTGGCGFKFHQG